MSKAVSFEYFCQRYELEPEASESRQEYEEYKSNLSALNSMAANKEKGDNQ